MTHRPLHLLAGVSYLALMLPACAAATSSPTVTDQGQVGLTSYTTLPFSSVVYTPAWGASAGLSPSNLFWQSGSHFTNSQTMAAAQQASTGYTAEGVVPAAGSQRWEDTYEASQPAYEFPGEPSWIASDRNGDCCNTPEYTAWVNWTKARPTLPILASDGGSSGTDFRPWKGSWGHISPLMPLAAKDCPTDMTSCDYGDWYANQWGQITGLSGAYGIMLSDFSDSQPSQMSVSEGFNPEIISGFETAENVSVPAGTISQESAWIDANALADWNDYLAVGYANFYNALQTRMSAAASHPALVIDQCSNWPSLRRFYGTDERLMRGHLPGNNYVCEWDDQSMQLGRGGQDPIWGLGAYTMAAAREPDMRNGANLEANDSAYWAAIASFNSSLSASDQQTKGLALLKRSWMEASWAHIATRAGVTRRALSFMSRDYWDGGTLDSTLQGLISSIVPTAPFGMAVYYSVAAERQVEAQVTPAGYNTAYYNPQELMTLKNEGVATDYYVSDAALPAMQPSAAPAAWIILEHPEMIPSGEMQKLQAIAPVLTTLQQIQAFPNAPLAFSSGLTGMGFYDQNHRLIITTTNTAASSESGTISLATLADGSYSMLDLFANTTTTITVASGKASVPVTVSPWDTRAFAITPS